ncbi:hypothetical protein E1286_28790 [Nonomuraea terrae]|uniref:GrpB family protein n=1 Tax=Nonomuraea terrae TaxID=2530383 RepID=A0A4R4YGV6_9ACTN|nr:GrpB family protein [Nonomuraea terrae]TDD43430.1 hypothetical protein E1286_28790 [Nonomuraea terrae]
MQGLWEGRIAPFAGDLARRRRAPRRQQVVLTLRDWLRADPAHRREYEAVKRELAARPGHDVNDYSLDKMPWISRALGRAEAWARRA